MNFIFYIIKQDRESLWDLVGVHVVKSWLYYFPWVEHIGIFETALHR